MNEIIDNQIKGFKWFLPLAFKDSVAQCKFEQGDVIYPNKLKGKNWGENIEEFDFLIQIKSPSRSQLNANDNLDVFSSNWSSKVVFEKIYPKTPELNKIIETTQGRLYMFLWKNNESVLSTKELLEPVTTSISTKNINQKFINSRTPENYTGFAMITDYVNNISLSKRNLVEKILKEHYKIKIERYSIEESIILDIFQTNISPTLGLELFLIESKNDTEIQEHLKVVLFKGIKNKFNINSHGLFIANY
ncbi:MAG: hypothetical protein HYU68_14080 [Bacteroidetes bacterium]|nr:hypothetical protein [Bacteroidota bacterium]